MADYYKKHTPLTGVNNDVDSHGNNILPKMSEFDMLRETLMMDDAEEGWASELRRYLGTMQCDVKKDTDLVEWWQVMHATSS